MLELLITATYHCYSPEEDAEHLERVDTLDERLHEHLQALCHLALGHELEHTEDTHLQRRRRLGWAVWGYR